MMLRAAVALGLLCTPVLATDPTFEVSFDASVRSEPASGRLVVYLIGDESKAHANAEPADGPFFDEPQPLFGVDVKGLAPGATIVVDNAATSFPSTLSGLPAGGYRVQAVLDLHRQSSSWKREPGNLYSGTLALRLNEVDAPERHQIKLTRLVKPRAFPVHPGAEEFSMRSTLLSDFHQHEVLLRAGIRFPQGYSAAANKRYPAVYEIPGFGGDHHSAGANTHSLGGPAFWIVLNPDSGNGHTLFADSANNGPWARALVEELIPALEARYRLIAAPTARILRGHSSGGWSAIWLALNHPETFGAAWSSSPDPVDFRRFQAADIYSQPNLFIDAAGPQRGGKDLASYRRAGRELLTIRQEVAMEEVLGPDHTSGQQWDSWFAVFGPRDQNGNPAALIDAGGAIDRTVAEQYRKYDIGELLRKEPRKYAPILRERVRLIVGDQDNYYLNEAVVLLRDELDRVPAPSTEDRRGYIRILAGYDHGSIGSSPQVQAIQAEMLEHLLRHGHLK